MRVGFSGKLALSALLNELFTFFMTAKEFILQNSPKFSEAVENGYDIRMEEDEILEWMQRFRDAAPKSIQLCPKCLGEAIIPNTPLGMHTSLNRQCPVCNGSRVFII